jgi:hypothetical protein
VIVAPGRVRVAYWVRVMLPPEAVNVAPGSVLVSFCVTVAELPGAVIVSVGPGRVTMDV